MAHSASNCAAKLTNKELTNKGSTTVHLLRHVYLVLDSLVSAEVQPDCVEDWAFSLSPSLNLSYSPSLPHSLFLSHPPSPFRLIPKSPPLPCFSNTAIRAPPFHWPLLPSPQVWLPRRRLRVLGGVPQRLLLGLRGGPEGEERAMSIHGLLRHALDSRPSAWDVSCCHSPASR